MSNSSEKMLELIYGVVLQIQGNQSGEAPVGGDASAANQVIEQGLVGSLTETAPTTDTGSSGLNGRLQRLTQKSTPVVIRPTITVSNTPAYSIGDSVGVITTLSSVNITGDTVATLNTITIKENGGLVPSLSLMFFRSLPTGTFTDNAAIAFASTDMALLVGLVRINTSDWYTLAGKSMVCLADIGNIMGSANTDFHMVIAADSTYAPVTATTQLTIECGFRRLG
jgi:hypothetical protein